MKLDIVHIATAVSSAVDSLDPILNEWFTPPGGNDLDFWVPPTSSPSWHKPTNWRSPKEKSPEALNRMEAANSLDCFLGKHTHQTYFSIKRLYRVLSDPTASILESGWFCIDVDRSSWERRGICWFGSFAARFSILRPTRCLTDTATLRNEYVDWNF